MINNKEEENLLTREQLEDLSKSFKKLEEYLYYKGVFRKILIESVTKR